MMRSLFLAQINNNNTNYKHIQEKLLIHSRVNKIYYKLIIDEIYLTSFAFSFLYTTSTAAR